MEREPNEKKEITIAHIIITLAVLCSAELLGGVIISLLVIIFSLTLLLIYYFFMRAIKLLYIPKFDIIIAFSSFLFWVAALFLSEYWSNISGWDRLIYLFYPVVAGIFLICIVVMNIVVYIIKKVQEKKQT